MLTKRISRGMTAWFFTLLLTAAMLLQPAGAYAAEGDAKAQLESAYGAMNSVKNGEVDVNLLVDTMIMDVKGDLKIRFVLEPAFRAEGTLKAIIGDEKQPTTKEISFYSLEEEKDYVAYYKEGDKGTWYKEVYSKEQADKEKKAEEADPAYQAFMQEMKACNEDVSFGKETPEQQTYLVRVDGEKLWTAVGNYLKGKVKAGDKDAKETQALIDALGNLGDVEYEVTVDRASNLVVSGRTDLTKPVANLLAAMLKDVKMDKKNKLVFSMMLANAKVVIDAKGSQYNQVAGIEVPESVVKNAKPAPKDKKDKEEKK